MIKLQVLALALATVIAEVRKTYPMIPTRFLKMRGLTCIKVSCYGKEHVISCNSENGINDRIQALNNLLAFTDAVTRQSYEIESLTFVFGATRGYLVDTYFIG